MNSAYRIPTRLVLAALLIAAFVHSERASAAMPAFDVLRDAVRNRDAGMREQALFWLVQLESDEAFEFVERLITGG